VVEAAGAPVLLIEPADDGGAALVEGREMLVGVLGLVREGFDEPLALGAGGSVDEDMKAAGMAGERAGRAAADENAVALLGGVENLPMDERKHALGVEDLVLGDAGRGIAGVVPEGLAVAVVPGIEALVEFGGHLGIDAGDAGRSADQLGVKQAPAKAVGKIVRELCAVGAVLPLDGNDLDRHMHHGDE